MNISVILSIIYHNHLSRTFIQAKNLNSAIRLSFFPYAWMCACVCMYACVYHISPCSNDIESFVCWRILIQERTFWPRKKVNIGENLNWTRWINEKGDATDNDQTIDPHTSLISARPSFLWWYACLTVKCRDTSMCPALNAFMHIRDGTVDFVNFSRKI